MVKPITQELTMSKSKEPDFYTSYGIASAMNQLTDWLEWMEMDESDKVEVTESDVNRVLMLLQPVQEYINGNGEDE